MTAAPTIRSIAAATAGVVVAASIGQQFASTTEAAPAASADEIVVRMQPGASVDRLRGELSTRGLTLRGRIPHTNVVSVATNGRDPAAAIRSLGDAATVVDATPNYVRRAFEVPDDPYVGSATPYLDTIRLTQAWDLSHGAGDVTIAVVDTGVSPVADLADRLLPGHNFVQDDDATFDAEPAPDVNDTRDTSAVGHGTLVAGIAAAITNNGVGIAGVAWDAHVLPVKVLNYYGGGDDFLIGKGIVWAADHGADIINLSLGGGAESGGLCDSVKYATSKGALVVAAAGNGEDRAAMYPAACPGAVAVTATDANGDFTYFSNYGRWVDLAAPGVQITSTRNDGALHGRGRNVVCGADRLGCRRAAAGAASRLGPRPDRGEARGDGAGPRPCWQATPSTDTVCSTPTPHSVGLRRRPRRPFATRSSRTTSPPTRLRSAPRRAERSHPKATSTGTRCGFPGPARSCSRSVASPTTPTPLATSTPSWRSTTIISDGSPRRMQTTTERANAPSHECARPDASSSAWRITQARRAPEATRWR